MKMLGGGSIKKTHSCSHSDLHQCFLVFKTREDIPSIALIGDGSKFVAFETCDVSTSKSPKQKPRNINKQFPSLPYPRVSLVNTLRRKRTQA